MPFIFVITMIFLTPAVTATCDRNVGPSGSYDCFLDFPYFTEYQCATCVTNAYMRQSSGGRFRCRDTSATYCYYQCMLENYGYDNGAVYNDCVCDPGKPLQKISLPSFCYSPTGTNCSFYQQCLAQKYKCVGDQAEYAITYGQKFCQLYTVNRQLFSAKALSWIDPVRRCLQVALVPLIRECQVSKTCADVRKKAFDSHPDCYLNAFQGFPVCDLSIIDWGTILFTIKSSFHDNLGETLWQAAVTGLGCLEKNPEWLLYIAGAGVAIYYGLPLRILRFTLTLFESLNRKRRDAISNDEVAFNVINSIGKQLEWDKYSFDWYPVLSNSSMTDNQWDLVLFVADTNQLGLTNKTSNLNMSDAINSLATAIQKGDIQIQVADRPGIVFVGKSLGNCLVYDNTTTSCSTVHDFAVMPSNFSLKPNPPSVSGFDVKRLDTMLFMGLLLTSYVFYFLTNEYSF